VFADDVATAFVAPNVEEATEAFESLKDSVFALVTCRWVGAV